MVRNLVMVRNLNSSLNLFKAIISYANIVLQLKLFFSGFDV